MLFGRSLLLLAIAYITLSSAIPVPNVDDEELSSLVTREPSRNSKKKNQPVRNQRKPAKRRPNPSKQKKKRVKPGSGWITDVQVPNFIYCCPDPGAADPGISVTG